MKGENFEEGLWNNNSKVRYEAIEVKDIVRSIKKSK